MVKTTTPTATAALSEVALIPVDRLVPAPWNPRVIRDVRFKNLCESLAADPDFLWARPILAMPDGTIFGGNMRFRAAIELGMVAVPTLIQDIPEQLAKERSLRDNGQWGEWHEDELTQLLTELKASGSEIEVLGFDSGEIERLLAESMPYFPTPSPLPTQADIDDREAKLAGQFKDRAEEIVKLVCPECGTEFGVSRAEILAQDFGRDS